MGADVLKRLPTQTTRIAPADQCGGMGIPIPIQFHSKELEVSAIPFPSIPQNAKILPIPTLGMTGKSSYMFLIPQRSNYVMVAVSSYLCTRKIVENGRN